MYVGKYAIANNFSERTKDYVINLLKDKKCSRLKIV